MGTRRFAAPFSILSFTSLKRMSAGPSLRAIFSVAILCSLQLLGLIRHDGDSLHACTVCPDLQMLRYHLRTASWGLCGSAAQSYQVLVEHDQGDALFI